MLVTTVRVIRPAFLSQIIHVLFIGLILLMCPPCIGVVVAVGIISVMLIAVIINVRPTIAIISTVIVSHSCSGLCSVLDIPQLLGYVHHFELFKLESSLVLDPDIFAFDNARKIVDQVNQFLIIDISGMGIVERYNWYSIGELKPKTVDSIVDDEDLRKIFVLEYPQVLDEDILACFVAVLSIQSVINQFLISLKLLYRSFPIFFRLRLNNHSFFFRKIHVSPELLFQGIKNCISIRLVTSSEYHHLIKLFGLF